MRNIGVVVFAGLAALAAPASDTEPTAPPEAAVGATVAPAVDAETGAAPRTRVESSSEPTTAESARAAVQAFEEGLPAVAVDRARAILKLVESGSDVAKTARLVEAMALLKLRRVKESRIALDALAEHGPYLGSYLVFLRVGVTAAWRECDTAQSLLDELPVQSSYAALAWSRVVSCWTRARDIEAATAAADELDEVALNNSRRAGALLLRARIAEAAGKRRDARDFYREILVNHTLTSAGRAAGKRLEELKQAGLNVKPLAPEELLPRAKSERALQQARRARRTYASVIKQSRGRRRADLRHTAELGVVELDIVDRRYRRALGRIERVLAGKPHDETKSRALYLKGDIQSRLGRVSAPLETYELAVNELPNTAFAPESALAAARLAYNTRRYARARRLAMWMLEARTPTNNKTTNTISGDGVTQTGEGSRGLRDQALWLLAWIERRSESPAAMMDSYLAQIDARSRFANAALYWRTRLAFDAGNTADAEVFASLLAGRKPTSFYAMAASDLIGRSAKAKGVRVEVPAVKSETAMLDRAPEVEAGDLLGAVVLFEHGLRTEAREILRLLPPDTLSTADRLAAGWLYRRFGDVHRAAVLTRRVAEGSTDPDNAVLMRLAYPRPYEEHVQNAALDYDVPADLIYAVIRQESAFNPNAVSPRRARGLMQMIRPTARRMARDVKIRGFKQRHLYDPEISIRLGTHYLASLLDQFDGNVAAAIASYHAGEHTVERWLETRSDYDIDEFIEEIPYATTRGYVIKVLSSYGVYRLLYRTDLTEAIPLELAELDPEPAAASAALR